MFSNFGKILALFVLLILFCTIHAAPRQWGLYIGGTLSQAYGSKDQADNYDLKIKANPGIKAGLFYILPVTKDFSLMNEIAYVQKGSYQNIYPNDQPVDLNVRYDLNYLEVPVLFCHKLLKFDSAALLSSFGFSFSWLLKADYSLDGSVQVGDDIFFLDEEYPLHDLDEFDYSLLYGLALDFSLFKNKFILEYRFSLSWYKINFPTYESVDPVQLSNQVHSLSLYTKFNLKDDL